MPAPSAHQPPPSHRTPGPGWFYLILAVGIGAVLVVLATWNGGSIAWSQKPIVSRLTLADIPVNGERAYGYLKDVCAIGPRISGTAGMQKQQELLTAHFEKHGGRVKRQEFQVRNPVDGVSRVGMTNLIVEWHPERKDRILLCCHYDTRPFPDEDPVNPRGPFVGANDGGSGVAVLMELAHDMARLKCRYGVDFVFFDGEELVYDKSRDPYFLGSEHFAREYLANPPDHKYKAGVLLDMVGDANLALYREVNSLRTVTNRQLVNDIWGVARDLGVREFVAYTKYEVRDDHLALNDIARIPTIDIIDFEYPGGGRPNYWHTTQDVPENCSPLSLGKVGWVVRTWLERVK